MTRPRKGKDGVDLRRKSPAICSFDGQFDRLGVVVTIGNALEDRLHLMTVGVVDEFLNHALAVLQLSLCHYLRGVHPEQFVTVVAQQLRHRGVTEVDGAVSVKRVETVLCAHHQRLEQKQALLALAPDGQVLKQSEPGSVGPTR